MSDQLFVRPMYQSEIPTISAWFRHNEQRSNLDDSVLSYESTNIWCVYKPNGELTGKLRLAVPVETAHMLGSLAPAPDLTPIEAATALRDVMKVLAFGAIAKGVRNIYFMGHDARLNAMAEAHGFERLSGKLNEQGVQTCKCVPIFLLKL